MPGATMQRFDGVANGNAVAHDLRCNKLGVKQLRQGIIVAGDVTVSAGQVDLMRDRPFGWQV